MSFDFKFWTNHFLQNPGYNDAVAYGVKLTNIPGSPYEAVGVHHLTPEENRLGHTVFVEILDEYGLRATDERVELINGDKKRSVWLKTNMDEVTDLPLFINDTLSIRHINGGEVSGMHTRHPDKHTEDGDLGNSIGHHSFYVLFKERGSPLRPTYGQMDMTLKFKLIDFSSEGPNINLTGDVTNE